MAHGLVLLDDGQVALRVRGLDGGLAAVVEEELGLVEVFLLARGQVELAQGHFRNLVAGHHARLPRARANLFHDAVGISYGNVQKLAAACGLPVGYGSLDHVAEVVEFVAQYLFRPPSFVAYPRVRVPWVLSARRIEVSVRFLGFADYVQHAVDIGLEFFVGKGLEYVARALDCFIGVGVVEAEEHEFRHVIVLARADGALEVVIPSLGLAFAESQGDCHFPRRLEPLPPK